MKSFNFNNLGRIFALVLALGSPILASANETEASTNRALGGDGVIENNKLYSLDLYLHGLHRNAYFDSNIVVSDNEFARAQQALPMFEDNIVWLFAQKLAEIRKVDAVFARKILLTAEMFTWSFAPRALMNVYDEEFNLVIPDEMIVQLALREGKNIRIDSAYWNSWDGITIDESNKVALIYHEILYALIRPTEVKVNRHSSRTAGYKQSSSDTHNAVAFLFSRSLSAENKRRFYAQLGHHFRLDRDWKILATQDPDETEIELQQSVEIWKDGELLKSYPFPAANRQPIYDLWMEICADPKYTEGKDLKIQRRGGSIDLYFSDYYNPELFMDFQYIGHGGHTGVMEDYKEEVYIRDPAHSHFHFRSGDYETVYHREDPKMLRRRCYSAYKNVLLKN